VPLFSAASSAIAEAIETRATPAVVAEVGRADDVLWQHAAGTLTYEPGASRTNLETVFDLASLTKVIVTTSLTMGLVARGRTDVDTPVASVLSDWTGEDRVGVRVRHLLDPSSGLPGHVRLWEQVAGREAYARRIASLPIEQPPGMSAVYSDPGFILLGFVLEHLEGRLLDEQFKGLASPFGDGLTFHVPAVARAGVAPTEVDPWRGRLIQGEVHDENAAALGGVAGHAGLFGTAGAVGAFARLVLQTFRRETPLGTPSAMRLFSTPSAVAGSSRALGWDTMRPTSSCGRLMSPSSIGHTGFTGTSLWIDYERDLYVVLLANRVHPTRTNEAWLSWRPRIHEAIVRSVA